MTPKGRSSASGAGLTLERLAALVGGRCDGDPGLALTGAAGLDEAGPGDVSFADGERHLARAAASRAGAVILPEGLALPGRNALRAANPRLAFALALAALYPTARPAPGVHPAAVVDPAARVHPEASVGAFAWIGPGATIGARAVVHPFVYVGEGSTVGAEAVLHPMVTVRERVRLGERVVVHSSAVLGSDGFGYVHDGAAHRKIPQVGTVEVGDDVEIGAGTTIDRATTGVTRIGRGVKIDNLVQVAHNVEIGEHAVIVSQVGIAGSARIGAGAVLAGRAAVGDHAVVGAGARVGGRSSVLRSVPPGATVAGMGPLPHADWLRSQAVFDKLPALRRQVADLERRLAAAEAAIAAAPDKRR